MILDERLKNVLEAMMLDYFSLVFRHSSLV
jgi:hypothetical protein